MCLYTTLHAHMQTQYFGYTVPMLDLCVYVCRIDCVWGGLSIWMHMQIWMIVAINDEFHDRGCLILNLTSSLRAPC